MKNAIGLILFGLLFRYGSTDVSHLARPHNSQYLPPGNQNLPIEQDYNGLDSQQNHGYLPPDNGNQNSNHGYLPPHQEQNHHQHNHHDHRDQHGHHDHNGHNNHHDHNDHSQNYQNNQQHQHVHQQDIHNDDERNHQDYDPSVQANQQHRTQNDHSHGHNNNQDQYDNSQHEHVDIDQQQLEPVHPSSLPVQSYVPPTAQVSAQVNRLQTLRHQSSVYNSPQPFSPAHSTSQQVSQNGYDYSPPAIHRPTDSLHPNHVSHTNNGGPVVANGQQHTHQGSPQTNHIGHPAPINSNQDHHGVPNQGYLPPQSQSSHGTREVLSQNSGHSNQEPHQDYLPPTQLNHGNPTSPQQDYLPPTQPRQQHYLPPNQEAQVSHLNHASAGGSQPQGYLPPTQPRHQDYLPPNQEAQVSHLNHVSAGGSQPQGYLPPTQQSHQDYLPPNQEAQVSHLNHVSAGGSQPQGYLPPTQQSHQDYLPPNQETQASHLNHGRPGVSQTQGYRLPTQLSHQNYLPPNQENQVSHLGNAGGSQVQDYLPPSQPINPNQENHVSHLNHASPGRLHVHSQPEQTNNAQGYLPPNHEHHVNQVHSHQAPQQDYLPPIHSNHGASGNLPFLDDHTGRAHQESTHLPRNHVSPTNLPFLDDVSGHVHQEPQQNYFNPTQTGHTHNSGRQEAQQGYLPPTTSNLGGHINNGATVHTHSPQNLQQNPIDLPNFSDALNVVSTPQLGSLHHNEELEAGSKITVTGHVNVPLPIPQVGYFFLPGTVSRIPSLNTGTSEGLRPALNIPAFIGPQTTQAYQQPTPQRISSPEYQRTFLSNSLTGKRSSQYSIVPSIQTQQDQQAFGTQQNPQNSGLRIFNNLPFLPQSNLQILPQQNQNQDNGAYHPDERQFVSPDNLSNSGLSLQNIARSQVSQISQPQGRSQFQGRTYLPPSSPHHSQQHDHSYSDAQPQVQQQTDDQQNVNADRGYLPPENNNQMTSLQSYMNGVDPNDRYGSSQYHNPPPRQKGTPLPPITISPHMYSKPSAVLSYAPGMAYKVSTNSPFKTLNPAGYLPALENAAPQQENNHDHSSLNNRLNEAAQKNLAKIRPTDNTVFPLEELFDIQGDDIHLPQLMDQLRGRIRTVQIINNHANTVKNIKVLETADQNGVKTIKIIGPSDEEPMGEHKVVHIVGKGSNPEGIRQTVKIFTGHKEVSLPTRDAYLPPSKATDPNVRVLRRSKETYRKH